MPLTFPQCLDTSIGVLAVDADDVSGETRLELSDGRFPDVVVSRMQACVAGENGYRKFEVRKCPFASGMSGLGSDFAGWSVFGNGVCDYVLSDAHTVVEERLLPTTTLDSLLDRADLQVPSILVLDAQGASAEILLNGSKIVLRHADVLLLEVELIPFFGGTASFATLLPFLWDMGFVFTRFLDEDETWATPHRLPLGQRIGSLPGARDAVFVRLPDRLPNRSDIHRLSKYASSCAIVSRIDFALEALRRHYQPNIDPVGAGSLLALAQSMHEAICEMPLVLPRKWKSSGDPRENLGSGYVRELGDLSSLEVTPLERVLINHGFNRLAEEVKIRRLSQAQACLEHEMVTLHPE